MKKALILATLLSLILAIALAVVLLRETLAPVPAAIELKGRAGVWEVVNGQDCPESVIINR